MATVYARGKEVEHNVPPKVGDRYLWFKTDRALIDLTIIKTTYDDKALEYGVQFSWKCYLGPVGSYNPAYEGEVVWNKAEWDVATLKVYIPPVKEEDLAPDEELCRSCRGAYFEMGKDLELMACIWCDRDKPGTSKKGPPIVEQTRRHDMCPAVPKKSTV